MYKSLMDENGGGMYFDFRNM